MKLWPFSKRNEMPLERRNYTDALIASLIERADGESKVTSAAIGGLEACAGVTGRAFASADVSAPGVIAQALTPGFLEMAGRGMIRRGDLVFLIDTEGGMLHLLPAEYHNVYGGPMPESWTYDITLRGPTRSQHYTGIPAASVVHLMYAPDPAECWRGCSPLAVAALTGKLSAEVVAALADEASGPRGMIFSTPVDGEDTTIDAFKADVKRAAGRAAFIEGGDWGGSASGGGMDTQAKRFGAMPPASLVSLAEMAFAEVVAAVGFNTALWGKGDSAAAREAWRLALFGVVGPLGRKVEAELQAKLGDVTISWQELRASDLSGRARAFQSMVGGGMDVSQAVAVAGLMVED